MKKHLWVVLILVTSIKVYAQEVESPKPLYTDRPGQSITPYTAGNMALQFQSGYAYTSEKSNFIEGDLHGVDLNTRFGISDMFEISCLFQLSSLGVERVGDFPAENGGDRENGFSSFALSTRARIMKGEGLKPAIGLEATYIAIGVPGMELDDRNGRFILTLQNQLLKNLTLTGNVVYWTNDRTEFTLNLAYSFQNGFGVFGEYWPIFEASFDGDSGLFLLDSYVNTGVFWQLSDDFMIDLAGGFRAFAPDFIDDNAESYYLQVGLTKRFCL